MRSTHTSRIGYPNSQVGRSIESLADRMDRFDRYHRCMDSSRRRCRLKNEKEETSRCLKKIALHTQFTIRSLEASTALTCIRAIGRSDAYTSILTRLTTATILVFASLTSETRRALTSEATYSIRHTSGTIQTWIW